MRIGNHVRQWVPFVGGSCDLRVGVGVIDEMGAILKGSTALPHLCALVLDEGVDEALAERVRRQLSDAGFSVRFVAWPAGVRACTTEAVTELALGLARARVTADDLVVAVGGHEALSAVTHVAGAWCGGTPLAVVPCSLSAALACAPTPRGIDVGGAGELLATRPCARYAICDPEAMDGDAPLRPLAHAQMVASAMCDSERAFSALWDRAGQLARGDVDAVCEQLAASANSRGRVSSSSAAATSQSLAYGQTFARALASLDEGVDAGVALAEGLRFSARLAAGAGSCQVDDVLTQDELLETLGVGLASCAADPAALVAALREDRFRRTNRFMLELPRKIGRVRLSSVDEGLLAEHAEAFCASRAAGV